MTKKMPETGASQEVLEHHAAQHEARCPGEDAAEVPCPCGATPTIVCLTCKELVFVVTPPGIYCEHAEELLARD